MTQADDRAMQVDRNGLEILERDVCLALLRDRSFGRLGLTDRALPTILPVNYWSDGERIFIRTGEGTKLDVAMSGAVVAFEVDDFDPMAHAGWSVVVTGVARVVEDLDEPTKMHIPRWAPSPDGHVLSIFPEIISGRRLGEMPPHAKWTS